MADQSIVIMIKKLLPLLFAAEAAIHQQGPHGDRQRHGEGGQGSRNQTKG
jgi:hypothetical protein